MVENYSKLFYNPSRGLHGYITDCFLIKTEALSQLQEVVV